MGDLNFVPVFNETSDAIFGKKYLTMYFGNHCWKDIILLQHEHVTVMFVFKNSDHSLVPEFTKIVSARDTINAGVKIVGSHDTILLLDVDGRLWRLINAFEFKNEKDENFYKLEDKCFYEWVPFKKFHFRKVLEISDEFLQTNFGFLPALKRQKFDLTCIKLLNTSEDASGWYIGETSAFGDGFACLGINKNFEKDLEVLPAVESDHTLNYTFRDLNGDTSQFYYITNFKINGTHNFQTSINNAENSVLLITGKTNGKTYICSETSKNSVINISNIPLVCIIYFEKINFFLLCYENGKLYFVQYSNSLEQETVYTVFLKKRLVCAVKCECSNFCLIWSCGIHLNHTKIVFQKNKFLNIKVTHLQVKHNITGVKSLLKIHYGYLAVTNNNFYYKVTIDQFLTPQKIHASPEEFLSNVYEAGLKMDKISKNMEIAMDFLQAKNMVQDNDLRKGIEVHWEDKRILLKSNVKKVLKKEFWKIRLLATMKTKRIIEIRNLDTDLSQSGVIQIESDLLMKGTVQVSLFADFGFNLEILYVFLETVGEEKYMKENELAKNLNEIFQKKKMLA